MIAATAGEFCYWDGTPPGCNGRCPSGLRETFRDTVGDGGTCWTGTKARCCVTTIRKSSSHVVQYEIGVQF